MSNSGLHDTFPAKLLLFGEYTVLYGSRALAMPLEQLSGRMVIGAGDPRIFEYLSWLVEEDLPLDMDKIEEYRGQLSFDSEIPVGYGAGSSGALVAASFDFFGLPGVEPTKSIFSRMEGFFHGNSSGLDPLVSYYNKSHVIFQGEAQQIEFDLDALPELELFDSDQARSTSMLVKRYDELLQKAKFAQASDKMKSLNNQIISLIMKEGSVDYEMILDLSMLQLKHMKEFIPSAVKEHWELGLATEEYAMKLSGAGGGGYFLKFLNA